MHSNKLIINYIQTNFECGGGTHGTHGYQLEQGGGKNRPKLFEE